MASRRKVYVWMDACMHAACMHVCVYMGACLGDAYLCECSDQQTCIYVDKRLFKRLNEHCEMVYHRSFLCMPAM